MVYDFQFCHDFKVLKKWKSCYRVCCQGLAQTSWRKVESRRVWQGWRDLWQSWTVWLMKVSSSAIFSLGCCCYCLFASFIIIFFISVVFMMSDTDLLDMLMNIILVLANEIKLWQSSLSQPSSFQSWTAWTETSCSRSRLNASAESPEELAWWRSKSRTSWPSTPSLHRWSRRWVAWRVSSKVSLQLSIFILCMCVGEDTKTWYVN